MLMCRECGYDNDDDANFCRKCGVPLDPEIYKTFTRRKRERSQSIKEKRQRMYSEEMIEHQAETARATRNIYWLLFILFICLPTSCGFFYFGSIFAFVTFIVEFVKNIL